MVPVDEGRIIGPVMTPNSSLAHHAHGIFQTFQGQGEHAIAHELLNDRNALAVLPNTLRLGVDPSKFREGVREALEPLGTGLFVVVFHAATRLQNFVGAHGGIAHKDQFVIFVVLAQDVPWGKFFCVATFVVLPHEVVYTVVEVIELQVLELGLGG